MANDKYSPQPEHKFSFGLWTVGNRGRDPFGEAVRPTLPPVDAVRMLAEVGAWGVNLHDNDLVPIDATSAERDQIVKVFKATCEEHGINVGMATVNLFFDPVFRDGAFTANDPQVRAYSVQKTMRASSPWRQSRTSPARTSICPPPARISASSLRLITPRLSGSILRLLTSTWPA